MAVPKKKNSKSRTRSRRSSWNRTITKHVLSALSLGKALKSGVKVKFVL